MKKYELCVVVTTKIEDEERAATIEKVKDIITRFGGNVTNVDEWGKRKLAYEIQKMKEKENSSDSGKTENGRKVVERRTALGMIKVDMEYLYPCVPQPGITEEKDGGLLIITASHVFRIRNGETEISPVLYQNCMHPEKIHIDPVQIRIDSGEICFQVRDQQWIIRESEASSVEILPWEAKIKKRSCIPCTNCGRCSW